MIGAMPGLRKLPTWFPIYDQASTSSPLSEPLFGETNLSKWNGGAACSSQAVDGAQLLEMKLSKWNEGRAYQT
jgi:hypothetical protein